MVVSSKFTALMAGEDRVTDFGDCISTRTADWRPHDDPCNFGSAELTAKIIDPAGCQPREMHLVKHLLREDEIDSLLCTLDRTLPSAQASSYMRVGSSLWLRHDNP